MLVRPCCVSAGPVNHAEDAVGANKFPRENGVAAVGWVAGQSLSDRWNCMPPSVSDAPGAPPFTLVWSISMPSSYSVVAPVGGVFAVQGPAAIPLPVVVVGSVKVSRIRDIVVNAHRARGCLR